MFLFIDACFEYLNIALFTENKIIKSMSIKTNNNLTDLIVEHIVQLIKGAKKSFHDLKRLYIVNGPGSFTGIKAVVIIAKVFSQTLSIPVYTISSLRISLSSIYGISILDAKNNKFYAAIYQQNTKKIYQDVLTQEQVDQLCKNTHNLPIQKTYNQKNIFGNVIKHFRDFQKIKDIIKLSPLYIKKPVSC
jgi:tRNA threonylcarbamoyl adenosine modification protein YeaZ